MPKIRLGINAWHINKEHTGIGNYLINLIQNLAEQEGDLEIICVSPEAITTSVKKKFFDYPNVVFAHLPQNPWLLKLRAGFAKQYFETHQLKQFFRLKKVNIAHIPYPTAFHDKRIKVVETVHDTIPWVLKEYQRGFLSSLYHRATLKNLKRMDAIITVSESSKKDILKLKIKKLPQIIVAPNAVPSIFSVKSQSDQSQATLLKKYGLTANDRFLFYFGGFDPRKNVKRLINIFEKQLKHDDLKLVLGGTKALNSDFYESVNLGGNSSIIRSGLIDENDLPAFFQQAVAYISLSKAEGFNIPLLMAISSGTKAIVSDLPVHHEVARHFATYLDLTQNDQELGKIITSVIVANKSSEPFISQYSFAKSAKITWELYKKLLEYNK